MVEVNRNSFTLDIYVLIGLYPLFFGLQVVGYFLELYSVFLPWQRYIGFH